MRVKKEDIEGFRQKYPDAKILAHPECHTTVTDIVDFTGSTKEITEYVKNTDFKEYVIATEKGVLDRLKRDYKDKKFYLASEKLLDFIEAHIDELTKRLTDKGYDTGVRVTKKEPGKLPGSVAEEFTKEEPHEGSPVVVSKMRFDVRA